MHHLRRVFAAILLAALLCSSGCRHEEVIFATAAVQAPAQPEFVKTELYFGLSKPGGMVSEDEWSRFVDQPKRPLHQSQRDLNRDCKDVNRRLKVVNRRPKVHNRRRGTQKYCVKSRICRHYLNQPRLPGHRKSSSFLEMYTY